MFGEVLGGGYGAFEELDVDGDFFRGILFEDVGWDVISWTLFTED